MLLQEELKPSISDKIQNIRTTQIENFDEAVRDRLS